MFPAPDPATRDADLPVPPIGRRWWRPREWWAVVREWLSMVREMAPDLFWSRFARLLLMVALVVYAVAGLTGGFLYLVHLI